MWKHANKNKHKNKTQFSENFREKSPSHNTRISVSEHQHFKIFSDSMLPDPPWWLAPSALTWFVGYLKIHPDCTYSQVGLSDYSKLKMKNLQGDFQFLIHLIICRQCLRPTPKNPHPKAKPLALWVFRKAKKNIEQTLKLHQIWTGLWAPDSDYWITATWSRIRNLSLNTADIYCNKLERILLPFYIFIERWGGKWTFCNLGGVILN